MSKRQVSNPLALAVLAWLSTEPMHPYELGKRLQDTGKDRSIEYNRGSLYMVVKQLLRAGWIAEHETLKAPRRPERTVYALTDAGRDELYAWIREWLGTPQWEYPKFGVALSLLSVLAPDQAAALLDARRLALQAQVAEVEATLQQAQVDQVPWIFLIEEDYRLVQLRGEFDYVGRLADALRQPGYAETWNAWKKSIAPATPQ